MSRIFDALQRSEAERPGTDSATQSEATEVLRRADRQAASKWETAVLTEQPDGTEDSERVTSFGGPGMRPVTEASEATEVLRSDEPLDPFGSFKSLQVSLSPESRLPCFTDSGSPAAEAFRLLGVRLRHLRRDRPLKKVLITSTNPQEGKR